MVASAANVRTAERILERVAARGVLIREYDGWRTRGTSYNFDPRGGVDHHDASTIKSGEWGALGYIAANTLSQFQVARCLDGVPKIAIVAAGRCGHAGRGGPFRNVPTDAGNAYLYGVEKANNGLGEPYTDAAHYATDVLLEAIAAETAGGDVGWIVGHKEWARPRGRKTDPTYDMNWRRQRLLDLRNTPTEPAPPEADPFLGGHIPPGGTLVSSNGRTLFAHQTDGNVVVYRDGRPTWASHTHGQASETLVLQADGNLVLYAPGGRPLWASGTHGIPGTYLVVQNDGNVVLYAAGRAVWSTWGDNPNVGRPIIRRGATGEHVQHAQRRLITHGLGGPLGRAGADGIFGTGTYNAVRAFQGRVGLKRDGVVGPATWRALG